MFSRHEIGCKDAHVTLKFSRHLSSSAAEVPAEFQSDLRTLNTDIMPLRLLCDIGMVPVVLLGYPLYPIHGQLGDGSGLSAELPPTWDSFGFLSNLWAASFRLT